MILRRRSPSEEGSKSPPAWIVSFTDMITLLLAFFVLLQACAHMQDPELFFIGRDAFNRAIAGLGIPGWLLGKAERRRSEYHMSKYTTEEDEHKIPKNRVLNAEDEKVRRAFADMKQSMETRSSEVTDRLVDRRELSLDFAAPQGSLSKESQKVLAGLVEDLKQNIQRAVTIYVIGLAPGAGDTESQLLISAQRAQAVHTYLWDAFSDAARGSGWTILSWGAGAGGEWVDAHSRLSHRSNIILVITEKE